MDPAVKPVQKPTPQNSPDADPRWARERSSFSELMSPWPCQPLQTDLQHDTGCVGTKASSDWWGGGAVPSGRVVPGGRWRSWGD